MYFIIDLILIVIIAIIAIISAKQGFVRTVVEVVGFVAAVLVAFSVSEPLSEFTYKQVVEPAVINSISDGAKENTANTIDSIWEGLPTFVTDNASAFGITKESLEETITQSTQADAQTILTDISQTVIRPLVVGILKTVFAVLLVALLTFVVKIIAKLLNKLFSFSIAGKLNTALGGALGVVKGVAAALIICEAVLLLLSFIPNGIWIFTNENIDKTILFKFLTNVF